MTGPAREFELKFLCTPDALVVALAAAPAGADETRELISVYFDTPDRALRSAGASLRIREGGGKRVQTLKMGRGVSRAEYETAIVGLKPNARIGPLRDLLTAPQLERLEPAFHVRVDRRQRLVRYRGAEIELAADMGEARGGRRSSPICELELELKSGPAGALFDLARELSRAAALHLSFESKAARGEALAAGAAARPLARAAVQIAPEAMAADALQAIARGALTEIAAAGQALRDRPDPEAVHQLRVGIRRLRSAFSTFRPLVRDAAIEDLDARLRQLAKACDAARNLDVFAEEVLARAQARDEAPAGLAGLEAAVAAARRRARAEAMEAAASESFRMLMIDAVAWVETGAWLTDTEAARASARVFAARALEARRGKLLKRGRDLRRASDETRHAARIEAKKLRYAAEGFSSLFREKAVRAFVRRLKDLQDALGALNDIATAGPMTAGLELDPEAAFAAGELAGRRAAQKSRLVLRAAKAFDRLAATDRFWA